MFRAEKQMEKGNDKGGSPSRSMLRQSARGGLTLVFRLGQLPMIPASCGNQSANISLINRRSSLSLSFPLPGTGGKIRDGNELRVIIVERCGGAPYQSASQNYHFAIFRRIAAQASCSSAR